MTKATADSPPGPQSGHWSPSGPRHDRLNERYTLTTAITRDEDTTTFRAYDSLLTRAVGITLFPTGDRHRHRRWREARILAGLDHPGLLAVYDIGEHDTWTYLVTRLVDGPVLADRLRTNNLSVQEVVELGARLADALSCVHRRGLTHRALTPRSVVLDPTGRPCLRDFSLAATTEATAITDNHLDTTDAAAGCYLAPEQVTGTTVGPPADVYSLGLILLEVLSGHPEYSGSPVEAANARLQRPPTIPADLPAELAAVLTAMTAHEPRDRPPGAQVAIDLRLIRRTLSHHPDQTRPAETHPSEPKVAGAEAAGSQVAGSEVAELSPAEATSASGDEATANQTRRVADARPDALTDERQTDIGEPAPAARARWTRKAWTVVLAGAWIIAVVLGLAGGTAIGLTIDSPTEAAAPAGDAPATPAPVAGPVGPPTLYGQVVGVPDPGSVVVDVAGQRLPVEVLGIDTSTIPPCAAPGALAFARDTLAGQTVTLVPDPTVPPSPARQAYVVLSSQLSYTDAALRAGWATPGRSMTQYRSVFEAETRQARNADVGMWGLACS